MQVKQKTLPQGRARVCGSKERERERVIRTQYVRICYRE